MHAILQKTNSNDFFLMNMFEFRLKFHWIILRVQITISSIGLDNGWFFFFVVVFFTFRIHFKNGRRNLESFSRHFRSSCQLILHNYSEIRNLRTLQILTRSPPRGTPIKSFPVELVSFSVKNNVFKAKCFLVGNGYMSGLIPGLRPANERRRNYVTTSPIGRVQA